MHSKTDVHASTMLANRNFIDSAPNKIWVGDITEIMTLEGLLYMAFVLDLFPRFMVGWATSENKNVRLVIDALAMAVQYRNPPRRICLLFRP